MSKIQALLLVTSFLTTLCVCQAQTLAPDVLPAITYPPIARAAKVQGDVVLSFRLTLEGQTADVLPLSGPTMLQAVAVENVKAWRFDSKAKRAE